jgi:hypothetical protein
VRAHGVSGTFERPSELIIFDDGLIAMRKRAGPTMPKPEQEPEQPDNVVSLGTESMFAIAEELRRMYGSYLREKPPERIARLMRQIELGQDITEEES